MTAEALKVLCAFCRQRETTGHNDRNARIIRAGDILEVGMRRGDAAGTTIGIVARDTRRARACGSWMLLDPQTGSEWMEMQVDRQLRLIVGDIWNNPEMLINRGATDANTP